LLLVLVASQHELVCEVSLVPRTIDQASALGAVPDGQGRCVGCVEKLLVWRSGPRPRWQRHSHADRLHVTRWHVDNQALDVAFYDGL